jgi:uncharacterized membrane protein
MPLPKPRLRLQNRPSNRTILDVLPLHIIAGGIALASGATALWTRKGCKLHRRSGTIFVWSMLTMSLSGATMAFMQNDMLSVLAGLLTAYLVATALLTVRSPARWAGHVMAAIGFAIGAFGVLMGSNAAGNAVVNPEAFPPAIFFVFGGIAATAAALDLRMLLAGGVHGAHRIARHLWRMCFALLLAAASFFLGQADVFPEALRHIALLSLPVLMVLVSMLYWLLRVLAFRWRPVRDPVSQTAVSKFGG